AGMFGAGDLGGRTARRVSPYRSGADPSAAASGIGSKRFRICDLRFTWWFCDLTQSKSGQWPQIRSATVPEYGFSVVGTSRCDVPARVQRAERISQYGRAAADVAPLYAARKAQRAVPTTLNTYVPERPVAARSHHA